MIERLGAQRVSGLLSMDIGKSVHEKLRGARLRAGSVGQVWNHCNDVMVLPDIPRLTGESWDTENSLMSHYSWRDRSGEVAELRS